MPVILTKPEEIETWMTAPAEDALKLQRPLSDGTLRIVATGLKKRRRRLVKVALQIREDFGASLCDAPADFVRRFRPRARSGNDHLLLAWVVLLQRPSQTVRREMAQALCRAHDKALCADTRVKISR
jgi:hypothetical protein